MSDVGDFLSPLNSIGLDLDVSQIDKLLLPFVTRDERRYRAELALRRRRLCKRLGQRLGGRWVKAQFRDRERVSREYEAVWQTGHQRYNISVGPTSFTPWRWRGQNILVDGSGAARFRGLMLGAVVRALRPKHVLEVGCGDGINLLLLAGAFPDISFTGLELTEAGYTAAKHLQGCDTLPSHLVDYAPLLQKDSTAFRRVRFLRGDATAMPFGAHEFDLAFTVVAIEQMERSRSQALGELARVARAHVLNIEPFYDVNAGFWRRLNVVSRDYFRGRIAELREFGLQPQWATADFPQETFLGLAMVLSRKATSENRAS